MKREQSILITFSIILITTVLFTACSQPPSSGNSSVSPQAEITSSSQTSQSTAEPDASQLASAAAVTPTMTPEADPRNELGSSTWGAVFDDGTETWFQYENDQVKSEVRDNKLVLTAKKTNSFDAWVMSYPQLDDAYLEVLFTTGEACAGKDRYGLLFRAPDNSKGYLFNVACDGSYQLRIWDGEKFTDLINWTIDTNIATGPEVNQRLGVWVEGDRLVLYVNGFKVGETQDSTFNAGTFGVNIAAAENEGFTVDVTEAKAWDLPQ